MAPKGLRFGRQRHITQDGEQLLDPLDDHFSDRKTDRRSDDGIPERADLAVQFWSKRGPKETFWGKRRGSQGCHATISASVESAFGRTDRQTRTDTGRTKKLEPSYTIAPSGQIFIALSIDTGSPVIVSQCDDFNYFNVRRTLGY